MKAAGNPAVPVSGDLRMPRPVSAGERGAAADSREIDVDSLHQPSSDVDLIYNCVEAMLASTVMAPLDKRGRVTSRFGISHHGVAVRDDDAGDAVECVASACG